MKVGRKPEMLKRAWRMLRKNRREEHDGSWRANSPLLLLGGIMSYAYATKMLAKLEDAGYVRKVTLGGIRIEYVVMLKDVEDLGEDVLGNPEEQPARVTRAHTPRTLKPTLSAPAPVQVPAKALAQPQRCVAIFADYENIAIPLKASGSRFPAEELLEFARKKGPVLDVHQVFVPMHLEREELVSLRQGGWIPVVCPPVKPGGGDTVDKTLDQYVRMFLRMPSAGTFIIVSRDADFQDTKRMVENHGRKCIFVYYDYASGEVRSQDGEAIPLSIKPQVTFNGHNGTHRNGRDANKFFDIVRGLDNGNIAYDTTNSLHRFILAVIETLEAMSEKLRNPKMRKHFMGLCELVWADVRHGFVDFSRDDVRELLTALHNSGVLERNNTDGQFVYYTFNDPPSFVQRLGDL